MQYEWILFDADETLFHWDAFKGMQLMFSRLETEFTRADYAEYQSVNKPLWDDYQDGKITAGELQTTRFAHWAQKLGLSTEHLNSAFLHEMAAISVLLPGAENLLRQLSGKVKLGIITNGFTQLQQVRLERTGLQGVFSLLVISEEVGIAKPHVGIFEHAFTQMNHPAKDKILMVGDNPHSDIQGGINAGIHTCWLNRHQQEKPQGIEPQVEVDSLDALNAWLMPQPVAR